MADINEQLMDLHRRHDAAWSKFTYFILAVTTASVAFALQRSESAVVGWNLGSLVACLLFWAMSFACGIKELKESREAMGTNYSLLELQAGIHKRQPGTQVEFVIANEALSKKVLKAAKRANEYHLWQLRFYVAGAAAYITWHFGRILFAV